MARTTSPRCPRTTRLFKVIRTTAHYAVHGQTAPELILRRADASHRSPTGLSSTWKGYAPGHTKTDVGTAKDLPARRRDRGAEPASSTMWLRLAEDQALQLGDLPKDWAERLDAFLRTSTGAGTPQVREPCRTRTAVAHAERTITGASRRSVRRHGDEGEGIRRAMCWQRLRLTRRRNWAEWRRAAHEEEGDGGDGVNVGWAICFESRRERSRPGLPH